MLPRHRKHISKNSSILEPQQNKLKKEVKNMNEQTLQAKQSVVKEIVEKAKNSSTIIVAEYRGLTVAQLQELRRALRKEDAELCVYKNSLVERAGEELLADFHLHLQRVEVVDTVDDEHIARCELRHRQHDAFHL